MRRAIWGQALTDQQAASLGGAWLAVPEPETTILQP